jgi:hypothetical protein
MCRFNPASPAWAVALTSLWQAATRWLTLSMSTLAPSNYVAERHGWDVVVTLLCPLARVDLDLGPFCLPAAMPNSGA